MGREQVCARDDKIEDCVAIELLEGSFCEITGIHCPNFECFLCLILNNNFICVLIAMVSLSKLSTEKGISNAWSLSQAILEIHPFTPTRS